MKKIFKSIRDRMFTQDHEMLELESITHAQDIVARTETLLEHLEKKFPDVIPEYELSSWEFGVQKGRQDVVREIRHLINTANK